MAKIHKFIFYFYNVNDSLLLCRFYWGDDDCSGDMDQYTAIQVDDDACDDWDCDQYEGEGSNYAFKGICDA